jgi:eukaryotic-like serine/threonine-protein kinase
MSEESPGAETIFILPKDVVILPVAKLAPGWRRQIPHGQGDFAVSRPRLRRSSQILNEEAANLLLEFQQPSRIAEAVARYSRKRGLDPFATLEGVFDALQALSTARILVTTESTEAQAIESSFVPGQEFAGFEIVSVVQSLEDTEVYKAKGIENTELVALKVSRSDPKPVVIEAMEREAAVLRHLEGPHYPKLVKTGIEEGRHFLACGWLEGAGLDSAVRQLRGRSDERSELHQLCCGILEAYANLHEQNVVHGDVHPGNILCGEKGYLLDFGLARIIWRNSLFRDGPRSGVAFYYEPEMAGALMRGQIPPQATVASDQYGLAVLIYRVLTGKLPQDFSLGRDELLKMVAEGPVIPFSRRGTAAWPEVERVLGVALKKDPGERFPSVREMLEAFSKTKPKEERRVRVNAGILKGALTAVSWESPLFKSGGVSCGKGSIFLGGAGVAYFLHRVSQIKGEANLLALADAWAQRIDPSEMNLGNFQVAGVTATAVSPYYSATGVYWVRALLARARGDAGEMNSAVREFRKPIESSMWNPDLLFGGPGWLLAGSLLLEETHDSDLKHSLQQQIHRAELNDFPLRRGVAHGLDGVLYSLLFACRKCGEVLPEWLREKVDSLNDLEASRYSAWCRGSAGELYLWTLAHEMMGEQTYLTLAEQAATQTWESAADDPSLCCGLAGHAFSLLRFYRYSGERVWLKRAEALLERACRLVVPAQSTSLYKGELGVALLEAELEDPEHAAMPLFA